MTTETMRERAREKYPYAADWFIQDLIAFAAAEVEGERERMSAGQWYKLSEHKFPEVATVSGEAPNYLQSGTLLLKLQGDYYCTGRCEILTHEKVWRFYDQDEHEVTSHVTEWAQIIGEEAL